ncbi:hypothetical protein [Amycolatopsis sp.]|uniref:hypothetical protein n=1 Tax=Amycolatopsis sp. TaxID=37632 RepID=UPI0039C8A288
MKTSTVVAILIAVLLFFASVAAATGYLWTRHEQGGQASTAGLLPTTWPTGEGRALRPVPIPAGELVSALPPDSVPQVLCQALSQERWNHLLGGTTLREVRGKSCHLVTETLDVSLDLDGTPAAVREARQVDIAGHPGEVEFPEPKVNARLNVRLVAAAPTDQIRPYLRVGFSRATDRPGPALDELITTVAREVVATTMTADLPLPPVAPDGTIPMRQADPVPGHGILDSPWPAISWQLCTRLARELAGTPRPAFDGRCTVRGIQVAYTDAVSPRRYPDTIAGRPALVTADLVAIRLTDDTVQELTFTGSGRSLEALAEKVLPALLGTA